MDKFRLEAHSAVKKDFEMVFIIAVGPRGDFYERLIRRIS